jgi:hypothetical protein
VGFVDEPVVEPLLPIPEPLLPMPELLVDPLLIPEPPGLLLVLGLVLVLGLLVVEEVFLPLLDASAAEPSEPMLLQAASDSPSMAADAAPAIFVMVIACIPRCDGLSPSRDQPALTELRSPTNN